MGTANKIKMHVNENLSTARSSSDRIVNSTKMHYYYYYYYYYYAPL
jgi:hypothetical protein